MRAEYGRLRLAHHWCVPTLDCRLMYQIYRVVHPGPASTVFIIFSLVTRDWQVASGMRILLGGLSATVVSGEGSFIPKWCRSRTRRPIVKFDSRGRHGQGCALTSSGTGGYMFRPIGIQHTHMRYKARTAFIPIFQSERAQPPSHEPRTFRILAEKTLHISKTF